MADLAPSLCFYGDDFTGSTDALDALTAAGVRAALLLEASPDALRRLPKVEAVGLAGMSRAMSPDEMDGHLPEALGFLAALRPRVLHYKVCSTFDSSPTRGSIGRAMDIGAAIMGNRTMPIIVGAPALGRYVAFGNLFARAGSAPDIHRLDRHPVMSRHPVTPMGEADLRRHLRSQTDRPIDSTTLVDLEVGRLPTLTDDGRAVLLDTTSPSHLRTIGRWLDEESRRAPVFCVGSSAVEAALATEIGGREPLPALPRASEVGHRFAVVSGSCSPVTARQIETAAADGFDLHHLDPRRLTDEGAASEACRSVLEQALTSLADGRSPLVYTARGHSEFDPGFSEADRTDVERRIGAALGTILSGLVERGGLRKVVVAGGDTSGAVARALGLLVLEVVSPLSPGAPLCRGLRADGSTLEIALKGGQMGDDHFFRRTRDA